MEQMMGCRVTARGCPHVVKTSIHFWKTAPRRTWRYKSYGIMVKADETMYEFLTES
jgi:hypothetical protein